MITITHNLASFNAALKEYVGVSRLTTEEALAKQGTKLAFDLSDRLKRLTPGKGSIRAERLAALKEGHGIYVRPGIVKRIMEKYGAAVNLADKAKYLAAVGRNTKSGKSKGGLATLTGVTFGRSKKNPEGVTEKVVKGTKLTLRALMVQMEISRRESGRGYLGFASRIDSRKATLAKLVQKFGRFKQLLASAGLHRSADGSFLEFKYGTESVDLGTALSKPRQQKLIGESLNAVTADIKKYLLDKQIEAFTNALSHVKGVTHPVIMAALRLATMQAALVGYLTTAQASGVFPQLAGIPLAVEKFGQEIADETVNTALDNGPGLCIISIPPFLTRKEQEGTDLFLIIVQLHLFLAENPERNLNGGLNRDPLEVVEAIWNAVVGQPKGPQGFSIGGSPMDLISESSAMRIYPIQFESQLTFRP